MNGQSKTDQTQAAKLGTEKHFLASRLIAALIRSARRRRRQQEELNLIFSHNVVKIRLNKHK